MFLCVCVYVCVCVFRVGCGWRLSGLQASKEGLPKPDFDFCICLGGDGTLLHYGSLYRTEDEVIPPVMTLGLGSLGFLSSMGVFVANQLV